MNAHALPASRLLSRNPPHDSLAGRDTSHGNALKPTFVVKHKYDSLPWIKSMSRLTIDVTEKQHQTLKALAALEGKTIKQYALERLFPVAVHEDKALDELKALLAERLAEAQRGGVVDGSIGGLAEQALLAERSR